MSSRELLDELRMAQELVMALAWPLDEDSFRERFQPEPNPLGWHLGHCIYTECYWLQEVIQQDRRFTAPLEKLYAHSRTPGRARGKKIPAPAAMQQWASELQSMNHEALAAPAPVISEHPLMQDDYLLFFLIQHYSRHYEKMVMVLTQRALCRATHDYAVEVPLQAKEPLAECVNLRPGHYRIGGKTPLALDNELPVQMATLGPCRIAISPVSNGEFLAFMEDDGYARRELWSGPGWRWLQNRNITAPQHWRRNADGHWYGIGLRGDHDLHADDVLYGISRHEAQAYARWAGGRLPHEHQWEVASRLHQLKDSGRAWEWCDNRFYPYEGYTPFPGKDGSQPWFDKRHYSLRGGCIHTRPEIRRACYRNFHPPGNRHVFAGLRLVYE